MVWNIKEPVNRKDYIIHFKVTEDGFITWDFATESTFDLCAVFPWNGSQDLYDYKKNMVRPFLYHRRLKKRHGISFDKKSLGYCLFPATVQNGILYIGNQKEENIIYIGGCHLAEVVIQTENKGKKRFLGKVQYKISEKRRLLMLTANNQRQQIYYKISHADNNYIYSLFLSESEVVIPLPESAEIAFYQDKECTQRIEESKEGMLWNY